MLAEANNEYNVINESNTNMGQSERKKPLLEKQKKANHSLEMHTGTKILIFEFLQTCFVWGNNNWTSWIVTRRKKRKCHYSYKVQGWQHYAVGEWYSLENI